MISYVARSKFGALEINVMNLISEYVSRGVSSAWKSELRCHELARAVARFMLSGRIKARWKNLGHSNLRFTVRDGKVGCVEHSWIDLEVREKMGPLLRHWILDVYVPGRLPQVQLIDPFILLKPAYELGPERTDIDEDIVNRVFNELANYNDRR